MTQKITPVNTERRVDIFGAGVTGLTAAHELVERGFKVTVYEQAMPAHGEYDCDVGGLARSQYGYALAKAELDENWGRREAFRAPRLGCPILFDDFEPKVPGGGAVLPKKDALRKALAEGRADYERAPDKYADPFQAYLAALEKNVLPELSGPVELEHVRRNARYLHWIAYSLIVSVHPSYAQRDKALLFFLYEYFRRRRPEYSTTQFAEEYGVDAADLERPPTPTWDLWWVALNELSFLTANAVQGVADQALNAAQAVLLGRGLGDAVKPGWLGVEIHGYADPTYPGSTTAGEPETAHDLAVARATSLRDALKALILDRPLRGDESTPAGERLCAQIDFRIVAHADGRIRHDRDGRRETSERRDLRFARAQLASARSLDRNAAPDEHREEPAGFVRLPGEHGYRFFPAFYRHIFDTMKRIPVYDGEGDPVPGRTVFDNLVETEDTAIASATLTGRRKGPVRVGRGSLRSLEAVRALRERLLRDLHIPDRDLLRFDLHVFRFLTSSSVRRATFEEMSWMELVGAVPAPPAPPADRPEFLEQLRALPIALVAMRGGDSDARTYGNILVQLMLDHTRAGAPADMTLNGPTSEALFRHWRTYLEHQGVEFRVGELVGFEPDPVTGAPKPRLAQQIDDPPAECLPGTGGASQQYYLLAVDVETARRVCRNLPAYRDIGALLSMPLERAEGEGFQQAIEHRRPIMQPQAPAAPLQPFSGVQFYLRENIRFFRGHVYYLDSPWGLTSISQTQFWPEKLGPGSKYLTVLSVDIGNWYAPITRVWPKDVAETKKYPWECSKEELANEVWEQIKRSLPEGHLLPEPVYFHVDDNLKYYPIGHDPRDNAPSAVEALAQLADAALREDTVWPLVVTYALTGGTVVTKRFEEAHAALAWIGQIAPSVVLRCGSEKGNLRVLEARRRIVHALLSRARAGEIASSRLFGAAWIEPVSFTADLKLVEEYGDERREFRGLIDVLGRLQALARQEEKVSPSFEARLEIGRSTPLTIVPRASENAGDLYTRATVALDLLWALLAPSVEVAEHPWRKDGNAIGRVAVRTSDGAAKTVGLLHAMQALDVRDTDKATVYLFTAQEAPIELVVERALEWAHAIIDSRRGHVPHVALFDDEPAGDVVKPIAVEIFEVESELEKRVENGGPWPVWVRAHGVTVEVGDTEQARLVTSIRRGPPIADIRFPGAKAGKLRENQTPYLITPKGHWKYRPGHAAKPGEPGGYSVSAEKIVLAGTYMKTFTRLTTMESANESARHAVNAILRDVAGSSRVATPCDIWDPEENEIEDFAFLKRLDQDLFDQGLPHFMDILELDRLPELMFPDDLYARRGRLAREVIERIITDDLDILPRAAADAMRSYLRLQLDRFQEPR